jgi:peptide deformylase
MDDTTVKLKIISDDNNSTNVLHTRNVETANKLSIKTENAAYQVKLLPVIPDDDPRLLQVSEPYDFQKQFPMSPVALAQTLIHCMRTYGGIGLSAIQLGIPVRVFSVGYDNQNQVFFNPKIIQQSVETSKMKEGCISYPFCYVMVERSDDIVVQWQDYEGKHHEGSFSGYTARVIQHEYDHLDGIVLPSKTSKLTWKMAKDKSHGLYKKAMKSLEKKK